MSSITTHLRPRAARTVMLAAAISLALLVAGSSPASAHERREVGEYSFLVGFMTEPAYEGQKNGVDFRVNLGDASGDPVEGAHEGLEVEVTHVDSGTSRTFPLRALFGQPGRYTADLVPTASGGYEFRFFGTIDGTEIDETFQSASLGGGFNDVEPITAIQFPETVAGGRELQGATVGARDAALAAEDAASTARTLGIAGIVLGALGIATGGAGLAVGLRRR
jgi:hypothetical protein